MAKTSQVNRNKMRERMAARDKGKRKSLKDIVMDRTHPVEDRFNASLKLAQLPRNGAKVRVRLRCERVRFSRFRAGGVHPEIRRLGPERRIALAHSVAEWLVLLARDPGTRDVAANALDRALAEVDRRTWGEVLGAIPPAEVAAVARGFVSDGVGRARVEDSIRSTARCEGSG